MRSPLIAGPLTPLRTPDSPFKSVISKGVSKSYADPFLAVAEVRRAALAFSYRDIFPQKFAEIVKVQLSFLVDVPSEMLREETFVEAPPASISEDNAEKEGKSSHALLKMRLGKWLQKARRRADSDSEGPVEIPCVREDQLRHFTMLIDFLQRQDNLSAEGLFRKSGNVSRVRELESLLASGSLVPHHLASSRFSPHDVAATLKAALARLSEPLLTRRYALLFGEAARLTQPRGVEFAPGDLELLRAKQLKALRLLFLLLPDTNRRLLGALLSLLAQVAMHPRSRMTSSALGIVFSPGLLGFALTGPQLNEQHRAIARGMALLIDNAAQIQLMPATVAADVGANLSRISTDPVSTCVRYAAFTPGPESAGDVSSETRMAVARLYAEVARWPPSERQRKMIRRLNNLNGGLIPQRSRCVDYLQRKTVERQSVRRRLFGTPSEPTPFPNALIGTPVRNDGPSLISFGQTEPLSPEDKSLRWTPPLCKIARCSPARTLNHSQNHDHVPVVK